jgi:geranylgeranyl diphosphate synthase, type I
MRPAERHSQTAPHEPLSEVARGVVGEVFETDGAGRRRGRNGERADAVHQEFAQFVARVRDGVESRLGPWLDARVSEARARGADVGVVADGVRQLTLRGGKRLRAALLAAAFEACGGEGGAEAVAPVGFALELFQTYLLAHDDLMDGDDVRRGGPSLPALMRARFGVERMSAMSILAGDLAGAWAQRALFEANLPADRLLRASREFAVVHEDVVSGQVLDVRSAACDSREVEAMHALKTASYSVRGPVVMGAELAGARDDQRAALAAFAEPLGVAFQLRDDILGTFGDEAAMGKPAGNDLREGKRTALVVEALRDPRAAEGLARVLGRRDATDEDVRKAVALIEACGARGRIEARIAELTNHSRAALERCALAPSGRALLECAIGALTERQT